MNSSIDKLIAYLTLFSGLAISGVAEYYSIMGLIAIYPVALVPIVIMGVVLGIGKISGTVWLKQNWDWSPLFLKMYVLPAILVLMMITSLGVFGFLSKAHSDQSLVSGGVTARLESFNQSIQVEQENIKQFKQDLAQLDSQVNQMLSRTTDAGGTNRSVQIRKQQAAERRQLQNNIGEAQARIQSIEQERAPVLAELRKVDAEVGPIKYIARLLYGENPDANILEKAVIWVTVLIVTVLDPLAVVLLLASQYSFQRFREMDHDPDAPLLYVADVGEKPTPEELAEEPEPEPVPGTITPEEDEEFNRIEQQNLLKKDQAVKPSVIDPVVLEEMFAEPEHTGYQIMPELIQPPAVVPPTPIVRSERPMRTKVFKRPEPAAAPANITEEVVQQVLESTSTTSAKIHPVADGEYVHVNGQTYHRNSVPRGILDGYVQNEEQAESSLWSHTKKD